MSLVGPRPIVAKEKIRYGHRFSQYCKVKPGLTGLWQVSGRNDVSYQSRVALDTIYVKKRSIKLNWIILFCTIPAVLLRKGSY
jgi:exopolysaccharide production protein ExoY